MNYTQLIKGLRDAYEHHGGIKTLHLGALDRAWFAEVQREASVIISRAAASDVTSPAHVTNWTRPKGKVQQFSLYNESGRTEDYKGDFGYRGDARKKRLVLPEMKSIARLAKLFGGSLRNLRLNGIARGSGLSAHEEGSIQSHAGGTVYIARFHLPVFSNDRAFVYLDDERFRYEEGHLYFFNHGCVHAATNDGDDPRYHIVLDCFLDRSLFRDLFSGRPAQDPGFKKSIGHETAVSADNFVFPDFACEDGRIIATGIQYGRRAPTLTDYYRRNYPSLFNFLPRKRPSAQTATH
jgi:hypothetical protein